jgi:hypothetical protein
MHISFELLFFMQQLLFLSPTNYLFIFQPPTAMHNELRREELLKSDDLIYELLC